MPTGIYERKVSFNKFEIKGKITYLYIKNKIAIIDTEDLEKIKQYFWYLNGEKYKYVCTRKMKNKKTSKIYLHRIVTDCPKGNVVDHINGNTLDNRKCNLRICSTMENVRNSKLSSKNTSGIKGVYYNKKHKKWYAQIGYNSKVILLGRFNEKQDATKARKQAELKLFKEFRRKG